MEKNKQNSRQRKYRGTALLLAVLLNLTGCQSTLTETDIYQETVRESSALPRDEEVTEPIVEETQKVKATQSKEPSYPEDTVSEYLTEIIPFASGTVLDQQRVDFARLSIYFTSSEIQLGDEIYGRINGKSYRENEHIALSELRYLKLLHYNFEHEIQVGELIVNQGAAADFLGIFSRLFENGYEIEQMHLVDGYWSDGKEEEISGGEVQSENPAVIGFHSLKKAPGIRIGDGVSADSESMKFNNTSCFNYREVPGNKSLSRHSFGLAIDINPLQNPYVVFDSQGNPIMEYEGDISYMDRNNMRPHMISHEDLAFQLFLEQGFQWGGDWNSSHDYQHFDRKPDR